jgi:hypothetical protein
MPVEIKVVVSIFSGFFGICTLIVVYTLIERAYNDYMCKTYGCKFVDRYYAVTKRSDELREVTSEWIIKIPTCKRCGKKKEVEWLEKIGYSHSFSAPREYWREMDVVGYKVDFECDEKGYKK